MPGEVEIDALKTWEEPAQRRPRGGRAYLIGQRLPSRGPLLAHADLGQRVDQQAERHDEGKCHDALGFLNAD